MIVPSAEEREGYVPNVVYSCGGMIHGDALILPYTAADTSTRFVSLSVDRLLTRLTET